MNRAGGDLQDRIRRLGLDPRCIAPADLERIEEIDRAAPMTAAELLLAVGSVYRARPQETGR